MISGETDQSLNASIRKARSELDSLERKAGLSSKAISESFGGMSVEGINKLGDISDKAFGAIVKGSKLAAAGIAGIAAASTYVGMGFEEQSHFTSIGRRHGAAYGTGEKDGGNHQVFRRRGR